MNKNGRSFAIRNGRERAIFSMWGPIKRINGEPIRWITKPKPFKLPKARIRERVPTNINAITANNLKNSKVIVKVWNARENNAQYMKPTTFERFIENGKYMSPFSRTVGKYKVIIPIFNIASVNTTNLLRRGTSIGNNLNRQRKSQQHKLIPKHKVGAPNTSGNAAFARTLANMN